MSKNERAEQRRLKREELKKKNKMYTYNEVNQITQVSLMSLKNNRDALTAIYLANILEKEPYDFNRQGIYDVLTELFEHLNTNITEDTMALKKNAEKYGVSVEIKGTTVQVKLDRGDDVGMH